MLSSSARSTICRLFCIFWYQPYPAKMYHTINPVIRTKFLNPSLRQFPLICSFLYRHIFKHSKPPTKYSLYIIGGWPNNINVLFLARFLKLLASNAIFRKIAYLAEIPSLEFLLNACWWHIPKPLRSLPLAMAARSVGVLKTKSRQTLLTGFFCAALRLWRGRNLQ